MELEGTLKQFPAGELVQMILESSVTGVLQIGRAPNMGELYSRDGQLYHATYADERGIDAVQRMFEHPDTTFRFTAGITSDEESIFQDAWDVVAYAERRANTWVKIRPFIPNLDCIPVLRNVTPTAPIHLSPTGWAVLALVDGESSVDEIALRLGHVSIEVAEALVELTQRGLITIKPPRPDAPSTPSTPSAPSAAPAQHNPSRTASQRTTIQTVLQRLQS